MQKIYIWYLIHFFKKWYGYGKIDTALIYAQAVHETGNFQSHIFKEGNNLFGMRKPTVRKNYVSGENRGHATFKSLFDSVRDYFERQKYFNVAKTDVASFIADTHKTGYATDQAYINKWENHYANFAENPPVPKYLGKIMTYALWALLIYFIYKAIKKSNGNKSFSFKPSGSAVKALQQN